MGSVNFNFVNGFSGHGIMQSPVIERAVSELVTYGAFTTLDLSDVSYARVAANRPLLEEAII
jgi:glycine/D-amino acid oxidase-like deaminating enzyme